MRERIRRPPRPLQEIADGFERFTRPRSRFLLGIWVVWDAVLLVAWTVDLLDWSWWDLYLAALIPFYAWAILWRLHLQPLLGRRAPSPVARDDG